MTREERNYRICNQCSLACIFNTALLDLTAGMTDSFEGRGAYSRGGGLLEDLRYVTHLVLLSIKDPPLKDFCTSERKRETALQLNGTIMQS